MLQSGWEMAVKKHWIGHKWYLPGAAGNDIHKVGDGAIAVSLNPLTPNCSLTADLVQTNVPTIRLAYRHSTLLEELYVASDRRSHSPHAP